MPGPGAFLTAMVVLAAASGCSPEAPPTAADPDEPTAMSATDFIELPRLSEPRLSPNGELLVYRRSEVLWDENEIVNRLRLVDLSSGTTEAVIEPESIDESFDSVVWAPDSSGFAIRWEGVRGKTSTTRM